MNLLGILVYLSCYLIQDVVSLAAKPKLIITKDEYEAALRGDNADQVLKARLAAKQAQMPGPKMSIHVEEGDDPEVLIKHASFVKGVMDPKSTTGEYPPRHTSVKDYYIDRYPVTNDEFAKFKKMKWKHKTQAERQGYSWVLFTHAPKIATRLNNYTNPLGQPFWRAIKDAYWEKPLGFGTNIYHKGNHPVVHLSYQDAQAYCEFYGKRLPTEDEWEYAARGGERELRYPWGDTYKPKRMNVWQGIFPIKNDKADGWDGTSPVSQFPAQNKYGLYDMCGNVWEWTYSRWKDPATRQIDDTKPPHYTVKGGSFVDSKDFTINYEARCSSRFGMPFDYAAENVGFRCARPVPELHNIVFNNKGNIMELKARKRAQRLKRWGIKNKDEL